MTSRRLDPFCLLLTALLSLSAAACSSDEEEAGPSGPEIPAGCNPMAADWDCLLPFPSDHFRVPDASLPSGHRVELTERAMPLNVDGVGLDLTALHPADGFSPGSQILTVFPSGVDDTELVFHDDGVEKTLEASSTTLLVDVETGERVLHFAEVDPRSEDDARRALVIRPLVRLADDRRYIVALRGLHDPSGAPLTPPEAFARVRDGKAGGHPVLGPLTKRYEAEIFPVLEQAGVPRAELILAWDFTTRTEENAIGDMLAVRKDVLEKIAAKPPAVSVVSVKDGVGPHIQRQIELTVKLPLYLEKDEPLALLTRDAQGKVVANGEVDVPFSVLIPPSVWNRPAGSPPARLMQYGHGFFGARTEAEGVPAEVGDEKGFVVLAVDWVGMADEDRTKVSDALAGDTNNLMAFTDRVHQAMANFMAIADLAQGPIASLPELQTPVGPAYDPTAIYFVGNSMGHILGGTYVALSPSIERAVLGVGGNLFSFMMFRAQPFGIFLNLMSFVVPDPVAQLELAFMTQFSFDRIDPSTYAPRLLAGTFPGSPAERRVLLHTGLGDNAVPPLSAELQARSLGIPQLGPTAHPIPGLSVENGPIDGSAINELDFGIEPMPGYLAVPPAKDTGVHEKVRRLPTTREQLSRFLKPGGLVEQTCDGVCDPE